MQVDNKTISGIVEEISALMTEHRDYLVSLDQVNGDGDLGISMDDGFKALADYFRSEPQADLGLAFRQAAKVLNQAAPSSLGTILSFGLMGMAKSLKGNAQVEFPVLAEAVKAGIENIMVKAESKPGEKTILDSLVPGANALTESDDPKIAASNAAKAAADGSEATKNMKAVHGRAAFTAARSIGILDGGSVVGKLIFEGINNYVSKQ